MHTEPTGQADSPSLDAGLPLTDSETESDEEVSMINAGDQDEGQARLNHGEQNEGQAGPNPGELDDGQAGSNPGDAAESQPQPSHVVHVGPNLEHMDLETTDASTQQKPEQMDEDFTTTAYPNVQENLKLLTEDQFLVKKPQEEEPGKTNAEVEVQSMVSVPIHQDTSSVPPMTTLVIDLTKSQSDSPLPTSTAKISTITTITTLPPPLQSTIDPSTIHSNAHSHPVHPQLHRLVSKAVVEIVTYVVGWAMQALLRARFRDLPTVDMKEILQQRMFEDNIYKTHEVRNDLYEALQKSVELDYSNQRLADQEEARKKKRKTRESPRTPPGSPPTQPPPPAGASGALGTSEASGSSQFPPPLPLPYTADIPGAQELSPTDYLMKDDSIPEEQVLLSDDEDSENDHQPKADSRKDWWKPLPEEERPATPEPTWVIPSSIVLDVENNWASALVSISETSAENSLLAKTGDMMTFMKWYCRQVNKTKLTQADFEGQAYEVVKSFYPNVIHLQFQMEECHKMLTTQVDWTNPEGDQGSNHVLSISKMKVASYPDFGLEVLVLEQIWIDDVCTYDINQNITCAYSSVVRIKAYSRYGYDYLSEIVLRRADFQEHKIAKKHFKNLYPSEFKDLNLLLLQGHLDHLPGSNKRMLSTAVKL
ncbi:hypothetical protein Tco_0866080 [Tanacetum coccineum]